MAISRNQRRILIVLAVVLVLCCGGGGVAGYFVLRAGLDATQEAKTATDEFIQRLESGDANGAYDRLCTGTKEQFSRDAFAKVVRDGPKITAHRMMNVSVSTVNGRTTALVTAELTDTSGGTDRRTFPLTKQDTWRVCGQPY